MATYVRNNAWNNGGTFDNTDLLWYARGVGKMMSRAINDPNSWWFYAAIHGEAVSNMSNPPVFPNWGAILGPPTVSTSPLPDQSTQDLYWNQCQHQSWYFPPWHRGYLMALEAQLRADIASLGGPSSWALPYWDYFGGPNQGQYTMPPAFASKTLPDGSDNPLYVAMRYGNDGNGNIFIRTAAWKKATGSTRPDILLVNQDCLSNTVYTGENAVTKKPGFGGPDTGFNHFGDTNGNLESNPHNKVHTEVGGRPSPTSSLYGLMSDPDLAALDPIFYLHHCNIDRTWASWNAAGNANPTDSKWLDGPPSGERRFVMPSYGSSSPWYYTSSDVTNLGDLDYSYQELTSVSTAGSDQLARRVANLAGVSLLNAPPPQPPSPSTARKVAEPPELLGASATGLAIQGGGGLSIDLRLDGGVRRRVAQTLANANLASLPDRVYLHLEGVRGTSDATSIEVYLNPGGAASAEDRDATIVGDVGLFGLRAASTPNGKHGGAGLNLVIDVSEAIDHLYLNGGLEADSIRVSLVPDHPLAKGETISVGRVALYSSTFNSSSAD